MTTSTSVLAEAKAVLDLLGVTPYIQALLVIMVVGAVIFYLFKR